MSTEKQAREAAILAKDQERDEYVWLMAHPTGRRFMANLLERTGVLRLSFATDAQITAFNEGARNVGLRVFHNIFEHCPEHYTTMLKEYQDATQREHATRRAEYADA